MSSFTSPGEASPAPSHPPLTAFGWSDAWSRRIPPDRPPGETPARVVSQQRTRFTVMTAAGPLSASISGRLHESDAGARPVVGDWVLLRGDDGGAAVIHAVLPRQTLLARIAAGHDGDQAVAANVDTVLIVGGLDGDHQPRRLRRYVAFAVGGGARAVIVLNKADLAPDAARAVGDLAGIAPDIPIHVISAATGRGLDALSAYLRPGETLACVGSSGVGKSTLVNRLLGGDLQATGAVRADDDRGRHTTTWRELMPHPSGAVIMDTPGMRELALVADASDLDAGFHDLASLAAGCRFRDCTHEREPGCAVRAAIAAGALPAERVEEWRKLEREAAVDRERRHERHARVRVFGRMTKDAVRRKQRD